MKGFFSTFGICYVCLAVLTFFGFGLIYNNLWAILAVICIPIAAGIHAVTGLEERIEKLEKRIEELEGKKGEEHETEHIDG